ncbi:MauE/DoxX family redox-associated membrane protein [Spongiivirga sp. MCCC 1A20706]|uniref:DoxX family protein n=1 Tax=Spongiivirga sp. MCCC 1A20706 TaxID=3160963 RepID=UPI0039777FB4
MKVLKIITAIIFGLFLLFGAYNHVANPEFYAPMIPDFIPESVANILATITELIVGVLLIIPKYQKWGGLGFAILMLAFLPIHIWDLTKELPAVGSKTAATIRLVIQFIVIAIGWWIYKKSK